MSDVMVIEEWPSISWMPFRPAPAISSCSSMNRRVTLAGWSSFPFPRVTALPVSTQARPRVSRSLFCWARSRAMVRAPATVWIVLVHLPAIHELLGEREEPGVQVRVGPPLTARLTTPQPPEVDQVKQRVRAVLGFTVEEAAGVLRRPGHHRRGLLADSLPVEDALLGPYKRLGTPPRVQLDSGSGLRVINCRPIAVFNAARGVERTRGNAEASCR
ncbi:hypothetical protein ACYCCF_12190 [Streptomyces argenteolus]|uniref:hypothetical protein n=1 Tax=Streptomyces sp. NPDC025273 TaxID=3155251 RepID=UPI0033F7A892